VCSGKRKRAVTIVTVTIVTVTVQCVAVNEGGKGEKRGYYAGLVRSSKQGIQKVA